MNTFIERSLPLGDRDDVEPISPVAPTGASSPAAGRKPEAPLVPELDLHLPRIEQAIDDASAALVALKKARAQKDRPAFKAAALRLSGALTIDLKALSSHVARAVTTALPRERQLQPTKE
jgi:hypothetical protein